MKRKLFACFLALTMLTVLTACGGKAANSSRLGVRRYV